MTGPSSNPCPRVDQLTDDMLDQLYTDLDTLEAVCDSNKRDYVGAVKDAMAADERAKRAEQLAADLRTQVITEQKRAEKAEAAIARVRDWCDQLDARTRELTNDPAAANPIAGGVRTALDDTA